MIERNIRVQEAASISNVGVIDINPSLLNPKVSDLVFGAILGGHPSALVLSTYATGATPDIITPYIEESTIQGIPVFLLSKNPGDNHGIQAIKYGAQEGAVLAGAIPLRDVNINNREEVIAFLDEGIEQGLRGADLIQLAIERFGSPIE